MIYANHGIGANGLVVEWSEPIIVPLKAGIKKYELKLHEHLVNQVALGVVSFTYDEVETTNLGYQTVNSILHKNMFLTFASHNATEPIHSLPMEMLRMQQNDNRWFQMYVPFIDISKSHFEINIPPRVVTAIAGGQDPKTVVGSLEYAEENKEAILLQFAYQKPQMLDYKREDIFIVDKPAYYEDLCR